ncbi:hypothetical protein [Xanthovirga aplysinae]|uniref:hypothetical protein n=1 Tax=Xanthovirga aplysinae TaxID=2529853 RepID=UPI0012BD52A5|nr:hypothetical protein [Xanthovirga aplysinae]MTI32817.1 hypothetical protein [Xanthovirga aplysinae]
MVQTVTIDGKKYPCRTSYKAIKRFQNHTGRAITDFGKHVEDVIILLYYSIQVGCKLEDKKMSITLQQIEDAFDADNVDMAAFTNSLKKK